MSENSNPEFAKIAAGGGREPEATSQEFVKKSGSRVYKNRLSGQERQEAIEGHMYQVKIIAQKIFDSLPQKSSVGFEDLVGAGTLGLIEAIDKYNPKEKVQLNTYAERRIRGAILDSLRSLDWASRDTRKAMKKVEKAIKVLRTDNQEAGLSSLTDEQVGKILGYKTTGSLNKDFILRVRQAIAYEETILEGSGSNPRLWDQTVLRSNVDTSESVEVLQRKDILNQAIKELNFSDKDSKILRLHYVDGLSQAQIAKMLGVSEAQISLHHAKALKQLRVYFLDKGIDSTKYI